MAFIYDLTDTWNAGGTTFNAIKMNVTDTASAAASKLITVQVGGSEKFSVKKDGVGYFSGNVGIGTVSPSRALEIDVAGTSALRLTDSSTPTTYAEIISANGTLSLSADGGNAVGSSNIQFDVDASELMRLNSTGLGIGTTSPSRILDLSSNVPAVRLTDTTTSGLYHEVLGDGSSLSIRADQGSVGASSSINFLVDSSERMRIDSAGNVGIGTSSPATLTAGITALSISDQGAKTTGDKIGELNFVTDDGSFTGTYADGIGAAISAVATSATGAAYGLSFTTATITGSNRAERVRITETGSVGIGTSSPSAKLHVSGTAATAAVLGRTSSDTNCNIEYRGSATSVYAGKGAGDIWAVGSGSDLSNATTTKFVVDTGNGNVGIGTTSPLFSSGSGLEISRSSSTATLRLQREGTGPSSMELRSGSNNGEILVTSNSPLLFGTNGSERGRFGPSGDFLLYTTSFASGAGVKFSATDPGFLRTKKAGTASQSHIVFSNDNGDVGSVGTSGTATSYNTSSDARLKDNIADAEDAANLIDAIQVRKFDWKADGSHQRYGMIAQELVEVAPEAVQVPQDEDEMMGVDYSKLVPMLVKEIQSLRARVAQLEG